MKRLFFVLNLLPLILAAQNTSFDISVNKDSVLMGNVIKVAFNIENVNGKFEPPAFEHFNIVSGPNTSSSIYSINGETTQSIKYSYFIKPKKEGVFFIENAYLIMADESKNMETEAVKIVVKPNPSGIIEEDEMNNGSSFFFSFPGGGDVPPSISNPQKSDIKKDKPKRKVKRI